MPRARWAPRAERASRPRALAATAGCLAALAVPGCGGGDDETTTGAGTTTDAQATVSTTTESTSTPPKPDSTPASRQSSDLDAVRREFNDELRRVLVGRQGLSSDQADCAIDELQTALTDQALRELRETGKPPPDLIDAAFDAGAACKNE